MSLAASDPPGLYLFNTSGTPVSEFTVATNGGRLWIGDNQGTGMIDGRVTEAGVGVVRAGPRIGGPIEITGQPFAILGKK